MKRLLCFAAALCLLATPAFAQVVVEAQPLTGIQYYPEGSTADTATYVFSYSYPQFEAQSDTAAAINAYLASLAADTAASSAPDAAADTQPVGMMPANYTKLDYRITCDTDDYVSVLMQSRQFLGITETESWTALVFALNGVYAGQPVSLSQAMGMEQESDGQGNSYASDLVYGLVWKIIQQQQAALQKDYFPALTYDDLVSVFTPESDFYLDGDGNFVFYIQSGQIAGEVEGILTYPFSMAELLSAVQEQPVTETSTGSG